MLVILLLIHCSTIYRCSEQYRENIPLDGFNFITLEDGRIVMTIRNHFPFDLTNVEFEVRTGTFDENELLGTFSFDRINGLSLPKGLSIS